MPAIQKLLIISAFLGILYPRAAAGESSLDFFFKDSARYQDVIVKEIRSTDTIVLEESVGEKPETIKLIGLRGLTIAKRDTGKERDRYGFAVKEPVSPLTPVEELALEFTKELLEGRHVRLEFDVEKTDEDFTTMAYVFLLKDNTFVNTEILRNGFAHLQIRPPNTKYAEELREAYKEAHMEKRGLQGQ